MSEMPQQRRKGQSTLPVKVGQEPRTEMNSKAEKNRHIIPAVSIVYSLLGAENKSEAKPHTCKTLLRR